MKFGGKNRQKSRYVIDITRADLLSLKELGGGGVNSEKLEKMKYFLLTKEWSDLNKVRFLEGYRVSELFF